MGAVIPLRVLCVDDNQDAADTMAAVLELYGYEVRAWSPGTSVRTLHDRLRQSVSTLAEIGVVEPSDIDDVVGRATMPDADDRFPAVGLLATALALAAQAIGELTGFSLGVLGDAQLTLAAAAAGIAAAIVAIAEGPPKG